MSKNKTLVKLMRLLVTALGVGVGAALGTLAVPLLVRMAPGFAELPYSAFAVYAGLCLVCGVLGFVLSYAFAEHTLGWIASFEKRWEKFSTQQILLGTLGLILGLAVAALINQLVQFAGPSLLTVSASALMYLLLGYVGLRTGLKRSDRKWFHRLRHEEAEPEGETKTIPTLPRKLLDTSVIIDGRILDIVKTGFLEGEIVVPQFVLAELRHIADSGDSMRRARGRRGLDVLAKLQKEAVITVDETDYPDLAEVDVKLLRLCRDSGGAVVTNDYNLNKVAAVTGIRVLNINDLSNAVKPILMAGEELTVQIVREGKEPGQGVAYLDDGTMIVVEGGRAHVGELVTAVVTTVLQTSAGRMIFTKLQERPAVSEGVDTSAARRGA